MLDFLTILTFLIEIFLKIKICVSVVNNRVFYSRDLTSNFKCLIQTKIPHYLNKTKKKLFNIPLIYETTVINFQIQFQTVFRGQLENLTIVIKW